MLSVLPTICMLLKIKLSGLPTIRMITSCPCCRDYRQSCMFTLSSTCCRDSRQSRMFISFSCCRDYRQFTFWYRRDYRQPSCWHRASVAKHGHLNFKTSINIDMHYLTREIFCAVSYQQFTQSITHALPRSALCAVNTNTHFESNFKPNKSSKQETNKQKQERANKDWLVKSIKQKKMKIKKNGMQNCKWSLVLPCCEYFSGMLKCFCF